MRVGTAEDQPVVIDDNKPSPGQKEAKFEENCVQYVSCGRIRKPDSSHYWKDNLSVSSYNWSLTDLNSKLLRSLGFRTASIVSIPSLFIPTRDDGLRATIWENSRDFRILCRCFFEHSSRDLAAEVITSYFWAAFKTQQAISPLFRPSRFLRSWLFVTCSWWNYFYH